MTNRLPKRKAFVSGAMAKNPARYRSGPRLDATRPLGDPYASMSAAEKRHWREIERDMPWVHSAHRLIVRLACMLQARMDEGKLGLTGVRSLLSILAKLGATPVDEGKVSSGSSGGNDDGFDFDRPH